MRDKILSSIERNWSVSVKHSKPCDHEEAVFSKYNGKQGWIQRSSTQGLDPFSTPPLRVFISYFLKGGNGPPFRGGTQGGETHLTSGGMARELYATNCSPVFFEEEHI